MAQPALPLAVWRKSTHSNGGGECVEVAAVHDAISVRDSKAPERTVVTVAPAGWRAFVASVKAGTFDR